MRASSFLPAACFVWFFGHKIIFLHNFIKFARLRREFDEQQVPLSKIPNSLPDDDIRHSSKTPAQSKFGCWKSHPKIGARISGMVFHKKKIRKNRIFGITMAKFFHQSLIPLTYFVCMKAFAIFILSLTWIQIHSFLFFDFVFLFLFFVPPQPFFSPLFFSSVVAKKKEKWPLLENLKILHII